jgi:hypothetical protein
LRIRKQRLRALAVVVVAHDCYLVKNKHLHRQRLWRSSFAPPDKDPEDRVEDESTMEKNKKTAAKMPMTTQHEFAEIPADHELVAEWLIRIQEGARSAPSTSNLLWYRC